MGSFCLICLWTFLAVVLHFARVGDFADWKVISWPWKWSCFSVFLWYWILLVAITALAVLGMALLA